MTLQDAIDEIKFELTGNILETELEDEQIAMAIKKEIRELTRYWDEYNYIKVPFASCIDTSGWDQGVSSISRVFKTEGIGDAEDSFAFDPLYAQYWNMYSNGGTMYSLQDYVLNYAAWSTLQGIKNTTSTDLSWDFDIHNHKLYINNNSVRSNSITIEYVPKTFNIEDIKSDYWIDILIRMSTALVKIIVGRIRTRYTPASGVWTQDGEKLLEEGNSELTALRERLATNANLIQCGD